MTIISSDIKAFSKSLLSEQELLCWSYSLHFALWETFSTLGYCLREQWPSKKCDRYTTAKWWWTNVNDIDFLSTLQHNSTTRWSISLKTYLKNISKILILQRLRIMLKNPISCLLLSVYWTVQFSPALEQRPPARMSDCTMYLVTVHKASLLERSQMPSEKSASSFLSFLFKASCLWICCQYKSASCSDPKSWAYHGW